FNLSKLNQTTEYVDQLTTESGPLTIPLSLNVDVQTFSLLYIRGKEVIQPHLPLRLPCEAVTPIICPTFGGHHPKACLPDFGCCDLSWCDGRCVQGPGTDSPWHADPRLLAIPTSCRRIAAYNPNSEWFCGICYTSRLRCPLFHPL